MLKIIKAMAVNNLCYKSAKKMKPKGIVVHSTGANNPYLKRYVDAPEKVGVNVYLNHWNVAQPDGTKKCVHAFIGYDKNGEVVVAEILPLDICCWGVGKGKKGSYNFSPSYIQFEICESSLTDKRYYRKAFDAAIQYCAELCKKYDIEVPNIVGHCEAYELGYGSNHCDPEHWMKKHGETMDDFRKAVSKILKNESDKKENKKENLSKSSEFHKGDLVSIVGNATYYGGKTIPKWVKTKNWFVREEPNGDRVVIDKSEDGTKSICSPIHKSFLSIVKQNKINKCPYLVSIEDNLINIHKGAGTNKKVVGYVTKGVYTIVKEKKLKDKSMWGKLKSGAGWIPLYNTKKM